MCPNSLSSDLSIHSFDSVIFTDEPKKNCFTSFTAGMNSRFQSAKEGAKTFCGWVVRKAPISYIGLGRYQKRSIRLDLIENISKDSKLDDYTVLLLVHKKHGYMISVPSVDPKKCVSITRAGRQKELNREFDKIFNLYDMRFFRKEDVEEGNGVLYQLKKGPKICPTYEKSNPLCDYIRENEAPNMDAALSL